MVAAHHNRPGDPEELAAWIADLCGQHTGRSPKRSGNAWSVRCPAHEDRTPSLSISAGTRNTEAVTVMCHTGCSVEDVVKAIGLTQADLFVPTDLPTIRPTPPVTIITEPTPPATYTYYNPDGEAIGKVIRTADKKFWRQKPDGNGGWENGGFGDVLYNHHLVAAAEPETAIFIVEGEKDADRLVELGIVATCNAGGAGKWRNEMAGHLEGHPVIILPDNDRPGRDHANAVAASLLQRQDGDVRIIHLPGLPDKGDVSDWLNAGHTLDELRSLYETTTPLSLAAVPTGDDTEDFGQTAPWEPVDLSPYLTGEYVPPEPTIGIRNDEAGLFYPGRTHSLAGPPESGKTWIALHAAAQQLNSGHNVEFLDFENSPDDIVNKLVLLGVPKQHIADHVAYVQPDRPISQQAADRLRTRIVERNVQLVVVDGVTNVMGIHGLNPNDNADVAKFDMMIPRAVADLGPCVITIDHTAKNAAEGNRFAIGAQHKLGSITGAAYLVDVNRAHPFAPGRHGQASISISKDRPGAVRAFHPSRAGTFHLDGTSGTPQAWIEAPEAPPVQGEPFRPTVLMERVSVLLEQVGTPLTGNTIVSEVTGKTKHVRLAIRQLIDEGFIAAEEGPKQSVLHRSVRPFREADDRMAPTTIDERFPTGSPPTGSPVPTGSPPVPDQFPTGSPQQDPQRFPGSPHPLGGGTGNRDDDPPRQVPM